MHGSSYAESDNAARAGWRFGPGSSWAAQRGSNDKEVAKQLHTTNWTVEF